MSTTAMDVDETSRKRPREDEKQVSDSPPSKKRRLEPDVPVKPAEPAATEENGEKTPEVNYESDSPNLESVPVHDVPVLKRRPSQTDTQSRIRKRLPGLGRVPSIALKQSGFEVADDEPKEKAGDGKLREGDLVEIQGLQKDKMFNGEKARVLSYDAEKNRWRVKVLSSNKTIAVRLEKMALINGKTEVTAAIPVSEDSDPADAPPAVDAATEEKEPEEKKQEEAVLTSRQERIGVLRDELDACTREEVESGDIEHFVWFDADDDNEISVWIGKIIRQEFDESDEASSVLATFPGFSLNEYWVPAIASDCWHIFKISNCLFDPVYKDLFAAENWNECKQIVEELCKDDAEEKKEQEDAKDEDGDVPMAEVGGDEMDEDDEEYVPGKKQKKEKKKKKKVVKKKVKTKTKKKSKKKRVTKRKRNRVIRGPIPPPVAPAAVVPPPPPAAAAAPAPAPGGGPAIGPDGFQIIPAKFGLIAREPKNSPLLREIETACQKDAPYSKKSLVGQPDEKASEDEIQILFSFDTTGSMYTCMEQVQKSILAIIDKLFTDIPNLRIAILAHGDISDAAAYYVMRWIDFTADPNLLKAFIDNIGQTGGGDFPECYELVLHNACREFSWSKTCKTRSLVMIGDAGPHAVTDKENNPFGIDWQEAAKDCGACGIKVYSVHCQGRPDDTNFWNQCAELTGGMFLTLENISTFPGMMVAICHREKDLIDGEAESDETYLAEGEEFNRICEELNEHNVSELKEMLQARDQKVSGTKRDLVRRVADGRMYGLMPKCPECGAGRLRVIYRNAKRYGHSGKGRYYCPGYYDDEDYVACVWTGDETKIVRPKWT